MIRDNNKPLFAVNPVFASVRISEANINMSGDGVLYELLVVAFKTMITEIRYKAIADTTAGMIRVFITNSNGINPRLYKEMSVGAVTISSTTQSAEGNLLFENLVLNTGQKILVSTHNSNVFNVFALGGELNHEQ